MGKRFTTLVAGLGLMAGSLTSAGVVAAVTAGPAAAGPATSIVVTDDEDNLATPVDGLCQLKEAIQAANTDAQVGDTCGVGATDFDTITFLASKFDGTANESSVDIQAVLPQITETVTIAGTGAANTTINGQAFTRAFDVTAGTLTVDNLTIRNTKATAENGGAIRSTAGVVLHGVNVTDSTIVTSGKGAGVYATSVSATGVAFTNNQVTGATAADGGGAIFTTGSTAIAGPSSFTGNSTFVAGSGGAIRAGVGIGLEGDVDFLQNTVSGGALGHGGCAYATGSIITTNPTGSEYTQNNAVLDGGCLSAEGSVTVNGGLFKQNSSVTGRGGAISVEDNGTISATGATFGASGEGNQANQGGGAIGTSRDAQVTITSSTFNENVAQNVGGGAIFMDNLALSPPVPHTLSVTGSRFLANSTGGGGGGGSILVRDVFVDVTLSSFEEGGADGEGGAISAEGTQTVAGTNDDVLNVTDSTFFSANASSGDGGGAIALSDVNATVNGSTFQDNQQTPVGGTGGGIAAAADADLTVRNSTFVANNNATNSSGGAAIGSTGSSTGNITLEHLTMSGNKSGIGNAATLSLQGSGTHTMNNSVVADTDQVFPPGFNCLGTFAGGSSNNIETITGNGNNACPSVGTNKPDTANVMLAAIADNGGPTPSAPLLVPPITATKTMLPQQGSPLLNAVGSGCLADDQRNQPRPPANCDIGAVEAPARVDLLARKGGSGAYLQDNVYFPDPQRMNFSLGRNKSTDLYVKVENEGPARTFRFKGSATDPTGAFKLQYLLGTSTTDVTAQVTSSQGYLTPTIATGTSKTIRVKTTIKKTAKAGVARKHTYTATASDDPLIKDQITSTITVTP